MQEQLELGKDISLEEMKFAKKFGVNIDELKENVKPVHKDLDEEQFLKAVFLIFFIIEIYNESFFSSAFYERK